MKNITRRRLVLAAAGLPILRLVPRLTTARALSAEPSGVSWDGRSIPWQELAADLARMERNGTEAEYPDTWQTRRYDDLIRWSDSVLLLFGCGDAKWTDERVEESIVFFDGMDPPAEVLAVGLSHDLRAWTMFVRCAMTGELDGRVPIGLRAE